MRDHSWYEIQTKQTGPIYTFAKAKLQIPMIRWAEKGKQRYNVYHASTFSEKNMLTPPISLEGQTQKPLTAPEKRMRPRGGQRGKHVLITARLE